jgi:hypothetical protein
MLTQSAKSKGRNLQKYVRDKLLAAFPILHKDDVQSCSMGSGGEDIKLSPAARALIPVSIECKSNARHAVYAFYEQAIANSKGYEPIVVIKQNASKPLVIMDLDYWLKLEKIHDKA